MNHLDDHQIQALLDKTLKAEEAGVSQQHLSSCASCRARMRDYQQVYHSLLQEPEWSFSPKFEARIMRRVHRESLGGLQERLLNALMLCGGIILSVSLTIKYTNLKPLLGMMEKLSWPRISWNWNFFKELDVFPTIAPRLKDLGVQAHFIIPCLVLLAAVVIVDRLIQAVRSKSHFFIL
jgi:hypothetical protein